MVGTIFTVTSAPAYVPCSELQEIGRLVSLKELSLQHDALETQHEFWKMWWQEIANRWKEEHAGND
jgi:hypothetical protein